MIFTTSLLQSGSRDKAYGTAYFVWAGVKGGFALGFDAFRFLGAYLLEWRLSKYTLRSLERIASQICFDEKHFASKQKSNQGYW